MNMKRESNVTNSIKSVIMYVLFIVLAILVYLKPLVELGRLSFKSELYSHVVLIPIISIFFVIMERDRIFSKHERSFALCATLFTTGLVLYLFAYLFKGNLSQNDRLTLCLTGFVLSVIGGFVGFFGIGAAKGACFPLLFLFFLIPIPQFLLDRVITFLQVGSAHAVQRAFDVVDLPYIRDGMVFEVPGLAVEVAKECSGIRSSLALIITSTLAGHIFLRKGWSILILILSVIPIAIIKNVFRITTITLLSVYVDKSWITDSWLHSSGGIVFFLLAICLLTPELVLLYHFEKKKVAASSTTSKAHGEGRL